MLNQSFSYDNFRVIFEIENRKANFNVEYLDKLYLSAVDEISVFKEETALQKKNGIDDDDLDQRSLELLKLEEIRDKALEEHLFNISIEVNKKDFLLKLDRFLDIDSDKYIYTIPKRASSYFTLKQLQFNLRKTFNIKPSDRYLIVKQLKLILADNFPKYIVRTDIKQFYESVPQGKLLYLLRNNPLLSPQSLRLVQNLIYEYNRLTGQLPVDEGKRIGIPRGVGISAYLAELYMREIDVKISELEFVSYYARYVDDMIIIFSPSYKKDETDHFLKFIRQIIENEGLNVNIKTEDKLIHKYLTEINQPISASTKIYNIAKLSNLPFTSSIESRAEYTLEIEKELYSVWLTPKERISNIYNFLLIEHNKILNNKTFQCNLYNSNIDISITFLGYKFVFIKGKFVKILLSEKKVEKYELKIRLTLEAFSKSRKFNYEAARKLLHARLSYLTKNTQLTRPKKGYVGIYYSNSLIEANCDSLKELNSKLYSKIDETLTASSDDKLKIRLKRFCFVEGFEKKSFYNLKTKKLPKLKDSSGNAIRTNFEKIVNIWK